MEALAGILAIVAMIIVAAYIIQPFIAERSDRAGRGGDRAADLRRRAALIAERNRIYHDIRELDFDYKTGKVADEDYADQRHKLVAQGVDVLQQLDRLPPDAGDPIEQAILRAREGAPLTYAEAAGDAAAAFCPQCGTPASPGDRFCASCGTPL